MHKFHIAISQHKRRYVANQKTLYVIDTSLMLLMARVLLLAGTFCVHFIAITLKTNLWVIFYTAIPRYTVIHFRKTFLRVLQAYNAQPREVHIDDKHVRFIQNNQHKHTAFAGMILIFVLNLLHYHPLYSIYTVLSTNNALCDNYGHSIRKLFAC